MKYKILSVGGSIIIPKTGFDVPFLKKFRSLILSEVKKGTHFILVVGGGSTCRVYQQALREVVKTTDTDLDWLGIHTTVFNAQFVRALFGELADKEIVTNPKKKVKTKKAIIVAAGWKPGMSTDADAVLLAKTYGATDIINLSNIEYVYDKDPNKFSDAVRIEKTDWTHFRRDVIGSTWAPGSNAPFDPVASKEAQKMKLKVSFVKGTDLVEVRKALSGKKFRGTVIE